MGDFFEIFLSEIFSSCAIHVQTVPEYITSLAATDCEQKASIENRVPTASTLDGPCTTLAPATSKLIWIRPSYMIWGPLRS